MTYQEAKSKSDLKHGTLVRLKLQNGSEVVGHVVYMDTKENRLFVRSKPGEKPVAYAEGDLRKIEKAVRQVGSENVVEPEIHKQTIYNGSLSTVTYFSKVLSPQEKETLVRLQNAENAHAAMLDQKDLRESALARVYSSLDEGLRTQRLINLTLWTENRLLLPSEMPIAGAVNSADSSGPTALERMVNQYPPVDLQVWRSNVEELQKLRGQAVYENGRLVAVVPK